MTYVPADDRYDTLEYRRVGRSGLRLPPLSLGLWHNFGTERPLETQAAIVHRAFDLGITHFDLANNYGPPYGSAETAFGRILDEGLRNHRDEIVVATKAGYDMWPGPYGDGGSRKYLLSSLEQSLRRMRLDHVDIFYSHRPDPDTPVEETMGALVSAVTSGKALYVGISNYSPEQTRAAIAALEGTGVRLLIHQQVYSMLNRGFEDGLADTLEDSGVGAIAFSPLAQGLLTDRYLGGDVPAGSRAATSRFLDASAIDEALLRRLRGLAEVADGRGETIAQLALAWVLRRPVVSSAIIGASSVAQLEQNAAAASAAPLTEDELTAIDAALAS